jgi:hypothetical protein
MTRGISRMSLSGGENHKKRKKKVFGNSQLIIPKKTHTRIKIDSLPPDITQLQEMEF